MGGEDKIIFYENHKRKYCVPYKHGSKNVIFSLQTVKFNGMDSSFMWIDKWDRRVYRFAYGALNDRLNYSLVCNWTFSLGLPKCREAIFTLLLAAKRKLLVFPPDLTKIICHKIYASRCDEEWE